jgi:mRNA interferase MazF
MTCRPGDLVLIPFPYSDLEAAKKRPVLALTTPDRHGDFIVRYWRSLERDFEELKWALAA